MLNKVFLIGRLGVDPELKFTAQGTPVSNISIATDRRWRDDGGQIQRETEWHRIVIWGRQAENVAEYLHKGSLVHIEGRLQTRDWTDKDGNTKRTTEIVARNITFLESKDEGGNTEGDDGTPPPQSEDDVPF